MADSAIDNDVVLKSVCYGFFDDLVKALPLSSSSPGILGTARFVLPKLIRKRPPSRLQAPAELDEVLLKLEVLEPTSEEVNLAAEIELLAQQRSIPLHVGECQLLAILFVRDLLFLLSGDKSALKAVASLTLPAEANLSRLEGKLVCLEQAILSLMKARGASWVRDAVCAETGVDTSLRVCFSCSSAEVGESSWIEGLSSHVNDVRKKAGALLFSK